jgi:hypothetical protein
MFRAAIRRLSIVLFTAAWIAYPRLGNAVPIGKGAPDVAGENWLNSKPLTIAGLRGRVVLLEFWTYG